jgi:hypothetical protein
MNNVYFFNLVLFSNLDELWSRVIMILAFFHDNMISNYEQTILNLKKQHSTDFKEKNNEIFDSIMK